MSIGLPLVFALALGASQAPAVQAQDGLAGEAPAADVADDKLTDWILTEIPDRKATLAVA